MKSEGSNQSSRDRKKLQNDPELKNPCLKEMQRSLQCLEKNQNTQKLCQKYFDHYNICRKFWSVVTTERRKLGIEPPLPPPEEREKVRKEYFNALPPR